ncbi:hypothetical protein NN3_19510 [Nocardia neocaledoniensis NBRC 108232]|uniref:Luciferase-like monooxygenase n=1 Tax=Nocardia neocaledoniensis TaxID=236511 RepID=A0A317NK65_9NOCA|nr:hypothetical protein [Nocardia neocaledoniensis]PWV74994.1 hypothetical protein DFR69_10560 [Nocardia neocaledoniensis]GEM30944.1 hypothetical protein NN3_19510 [Nocardia neocaledoniensis NBRC 108232]
MATALAAAEADTVAFSTPRSTIGPPIPAGAPNMLTGSPAQVADQLHRLRDDYGVSYIVSTTTHANSRPW